VEVTYHGRPELIVRSVEDHARLRQNRKLSFNRRTMPIELVERIASADMSPEHDHLNSLMDLYISYAVEDDWPLRAIKTPIL
jgi:hypothetical protein